MSPGHGSAPDVVVVGAASRDLAPDDPRGWRLGGAVSYGGLALARLGIRVGMLVGADAPGATAEELDWCRAAGAAVVVARLGRAPVFGNQEQPGGRVQRCLEPGEPLPTAALPAPWRDAPWWLLAPVAGELEADWAVVPGPGALVALGWQGLLRSMAAGEQVQRVAPGPSALLGRASLVGVSAQDLPPAARPDSLAWLLRPDAELLVTEAEAGGQLLRLADGEVVARERWAAIPASNVIDSTGAGDVFLAGVIASRVRGDRQHDLRFGAAAASLVIETHGMAGVPTQVAVEARLAEP